MFVRTESYVIYHLHTGTCVLKDTVNVKSNKQLRVYYRIILMLYVTGNLPYMYIA